MQFGFIMFSVYFGRICLLYNSFFSWKVSFHVYKWIVAITPYWIWLKQLVCKSRKFDTLTCILRHSVFFLIIRYSVTSAQNLSMPTMGQYKRTTRSENIILTKMIHLISFGSICQAQLWKMKLLFATITNWNHYQDQPLCCL